MTLITWLRHQSRPMLVLTLLGIFAGLFAAFWLLFHFVRPAPPRTVTIAAGTEGGAYAMFAERYRAALAREGIELVIRPTSGSVENLRLLKTDPAIDLGFVQSGIAVEPESEDLMSLGSMYVEPVWIFHRLGQTPTRLTELAGRRLAVGSPGSGTQLFALQLLAASGFAVDAKGLLALDDNAAAEALLAGDIDAAFIVAAPEAPVVQRLLERPEIGLVDLAQAPAFARRLPHLTPLTLPAGALDLAHVRPAHDVRLLGATAGLVARQDLHPAIVSLLLLAARDIHGRPGLFQHVGEYPQAGGRELPLSPTARRFHESGPPLLQRYLPFWLAVLVDRLLVSLLPVVALLIPLMRITPALYAWRMRSRIYRWYGELKFLESDIARHFEPQRTEDYFAHLDRIEEQANRRKVPLAFANELYTLREHIQLVRRSLLRKAQGGH
ncbi:TAXI family TRAP transporter solute-binding subunit [Pseudothauera rhizosphaerae]|uniref:C4-dicarboxylate ABC transporter substrate-binding protein n=1 Tax=Pseudothauera rhizosphaerae TaxID=2565932 RepID=A0A4S4AST7_9RHOO|nr:TAXI family TRAP transporter solute-binding subunit [Pseudothauera rhizosphaerae]THF62464.1 C4-dicarboxylate ABC transporter substrate-binding protein [Pseudothauera rhizosphaerae]